MKPHAPVRNVSPERKALYYAGMAAGAVGLLLFVSNFFVIASGFNDPFAMQNRMGGFVARALGGMALMVIGTGMRNVAARGLAGSGLKLDPEQARRDLEPWSRMGGGVVADALDEVPAVRRFVEEPGGRAVEVVRVRCPQCRALNEESDSFCGQCGGRL